MEHREEQALDKAVRQKITGFQPAVPPTLWDKIEAELDKKEDEASIQLKRSGFLLWQRIAAAVVAVLLSGIWWNSRQSKEIVYLHGKPKEIGIAGDTLVVAGKTQQIALNQRPTKKTSAWIETKGKKQDEKTTLVMEKDSLESDRHQDDAIAQLSENTVSRVLLNEEVYSPVAETVSNGNSLSLVRQTAIPIAQVPLVVTAAEEVKHKKTLAVSDLLNYVVGAVNKEDQALVKFSHDDEGTLSVAFNLKAMKIKL